VGRAAQPTIFREKRSITTARYSQPCHVRTHVMSVTHALFGRVTVNRRCSRFGTKIAGLPTDHRRVR
jgi:hypothetical protein